MDKSTVAKERRYIKVSLVPSREEGIEKSHAR
jgi:hypothetical protein